MDFSSFWSDAISGLVASGVFALLAYFVAYIPVMKRVKKVEKELAEYQSEIKQEVFDIYKDKLKMLKEDRNWYRKNVTRARELLDIKDYKSEIQYNELVNDLTSAESDLSELNKEIDEIARMFLQ